MSKETDEGGLTVPQHLVPGILELARAPKEYRKALELVDDLASEAAIGLVYADGAWHAIEVMGTDTVIARFKLHLDKECSPPVPDELSTWADATRRLVKDTIDTMIEDEFHRELALSSIGVEGTTEMFRKELQRCAKIWN